MDPRLQRAVAIKVFRHLGQSPQAIERFQREARLAARLHHPNIAAIYDIGATEEGEPFVVQELVTGVDLSRLLRGRPSGLPPVAASGLLWQAAKALQCIHAEGIVHRDIKPGNIAVLADGAIKLLDFGIARTRTEDLSLTSTGEFVGTPLYMAPEVITGSGFDIRSDIYSFGTLAFELLSGKPPFQGSDFAQILFSVVQKPAAPLLGNPDYPEGLAALVDQCLKKLPADRPASMDEVLQRMEPLPRGWSSDLSIEVLLSLQSRDVPFPLDPPRERSTTQIFERASGAPAPALPPASDHVGGATEIFHGPPASPVRPAPAQLSRPAPAPPPSGQVGEFTDFFRAPTPSPLPPTPAPLSRPAPAPPPSGQVGEFTDLFRAPTPSPLPPTPAPLSRPAPALPPSGQVGEFTQVFRGHASDLSGQSVGRFVLHERVAQGSTGDLYKAWDPVRGELIGVKVLQSKDPQVGQRLLRGGRIWIKINHRNILRIHEVHPNYGGHPGVIVCDLVDGENLDAFSRQQHLNLEAIAWIMVQVCDALDCIHAQGVVHREVKPRNILVAPGSMHVTLLDSGIARHANPEVDAFTRTGIFVGDLSYVPPEQASGRADQRTDVYSAVAVLYELVTKSKLPFPLPPNWKAEEQGLQPVPARMRSIIARGLHPDPNERFATIAELRDHLRAFAPARQSSVAERSVVALHGIRTQAVWQRAFAEVAGGADLSVHFDRWNFGYFSVLRFLMPWARLARVRWFRETYQREFREHAGAGRGELPSIVAHSFGTYILGNALLRYPYLRFNKVLLCGSILPTAFPWDRLIERGQVQAMRNEFGSEDIWTRGVGWFVPGTGPSGLTGFEARHARIEEERFDFAHSEYFERGHMKSRWLPYLMVQVAERPPQEVEVAYPRGGQPWALYVAYLSVVVVVATALAGFILR